MNYKYFYHVRIDADNTKRKYYTTRRPDGYGEMFVEVARAMGKDHMYVELCQIDRYKEVDAE